MFCRPCLNPLEAGQGCPTHRSRHRKSMVWYPSLNPLEAGQGCPTDRFWFSEPNGSPSDESQSPRSGARLSDYRALGELCHDFGCLNPLEAGQGCPTAKRYHYANQTRHPVSIPSKRGKVVRRRRQKEDVSCVLLSQSPRSGARLSDLVALIGTKMAVMCLNPLEAGQGCPTLRANHFIHIINKSQSPRSGARLSDNSNIAIRLRDDEQGSLNPLEAGQGCPTRMAEIFNAIVAMVSIPSKRGKVVRLGDGSGDGEGSGNGSSQSPRSGARLSDFHCESPIRRRIWSLNPLEAGQGCPTDN